MVIAWFHGGIYENCFHVKAPPHAWVDRLE
jgi:hypothetical protein